MTNIMPPDPFGDGDTEVQEMLKALRERDLSDLSELMDLVLTGDELFRELVTLGSEDPYACEQRMDTLSAENLRGVVLSRIIYALAEGEALEGEDA